MKLNMRAFGIVAEYNPFHKGHKYQIDVARELGATHVIAIMSPNFTQRGEPSILNKFDRAQIAVKCGVDLVIELPTQYAISSAEDFAFGAIYILNKLNIVSDLIFGVECEEISVLNQISDMVETEIFRTSLIRELKKGLSFVVARELVLRDLMDIRKAHVVSRPNNILAIEYLKWLKRLKSKIKPIPLKRIGVDHDSEEISGDIISGKQLRTIINDNYPIDQWKKFVPNESLGIYEKALKKSIFPASEELGERAVLAKFRSMSVEEIKELPDVTEGLEFRISRSVKEADSLGNLFDRIKTKRYTMSRIKRIIYNGFLGITSDIFKVNPPFARVLASNEKGVEIISVAKCISTIPIDIDFKLLSHLNNVAKRFAEVENRATNLYGLFCPKIPMCNLDYILKFNIFNTDEAEDKEDRLENINMNTINDIDSLEYSRREML